MGAYSINESNRVRLIYIYMAVYDWSKQQTQQHSKVTDGRFKKNTHTNTKRIRNKKIHNIHNSSSVFINNEEFFNIQEENNLRIPLSSISCTNEIAISLLYSEKKYFFFKKIAIFLIATGKLLGSIIISYLHIAL